MKIKSLMPIFLLAFFLPAHSEAFSFAGPLQVKNQFPLFLVADPPYLERASSESSFSAGLSHSSVFMIKDSREWSVRLDMEVTELDLRYRKEFGDLFELGIDIPFLTFASGFMDDFLKGYHRAFDFPDYGRSTRPSNEFLYEVRKNGVLVIKGENGRIGIGDIRLAVKKALLKGDPVVSVIADLELPTGKAAEGFGNGSLDEGLAILIDKRLFERIMAYANLGVVFPGDMKGKEPTIDLRNFFYGAIGVEAGLSEKVSLLGQAIFQTSPFPRTAISSIDRLSVLLSLGGRYSSGKNSFEVSFTEDPNTAGAPDFTMNVSFKRKF